MTASVPWPHEEVADDKPWEKQKIMQPSERGGLVHAPAQREQKAARDQADGEPRHDCEDDPLRHRADEPHLVADDVRPVRFFDVYTHRVAGFFIIQPVHSASPHDILA